MARTKYKLGTFVKTNETEDAPSHYGAVEEIRQTLAGTEYKLTGLDDTVSENEIAAAYREITPRAPRARTTSKGRSKKSRAESQANAAA